MTTSQKVAITSAKSQKSSGASSIISKLTSPFASKQNTYITHEIQLDKPFRQFAPGDPVKGAIVLSVGRPVRVTHLVVRLHGFVKVVNHSKLPGEPIHLDENLLRSAKGGRGGEYFGNGFARLFDDEVVLCGDGRLLGQYVFRFELALPRKGVPSSIDFENGTITYLITSILTRPTTISPTLVKDVKLKVKENIDIAPIPIPTPQSVSLHAVRSRRPVIHMKRKLSAQEGEKEATSSIGPDEHRHGSPSSLASAVAVPGSPAPSELSSKSVASSNTSHTYTGTGGASATDVKSTASASISLAASDKTITAQTDVLQGGCLPGDVLPVKVSIDHTKPIKSMQGIIITLYRSARIDTHPALPLGPTSRQGKAKYEDYYPRSRTGLGGLSLSSAGSSRTFRQDLAQTITPLIVDPQSLTAVVKTAINVPEYIFPTIHGVPGSMIIFKYFIEVVIDLRGKLGLLPKLSMIDTPQHAYGDPRINVERGMDGMTFSATPGFNYLITDQIRRQKGVVYTKTEVIIGTRDSARSRGKERVDSTDATRGPTHAPLGEGDQPTQVISSNHVLDRSLRLQQYDPAQRNTLGHDFTPEAEEPLDEKAQIRRAEQTLLPSAPPTDTDTPRAAEPLPSAPFAYDEEDFIHRYRIEAPAPAYDGPSASQTIQSRSGAQWLPRPGTNGIEQGAVVQATPTGPINAAEDKQELEYQRLRTLASSPDKFTGPTEPGPPTTQQASPVPPSAPIWFEDEVNSSPVERAIFSNLDSGKPDGHLPPASNVSKDCTLPDGQEMERRRPEPQDSLGDDCPSHGAEASIGTCSQASPLNVPVTDEYDLRNGQDNDAHGTNIEEAPLYQR
ncbi:MAG: hypothetical protein Q9163_002140 [Psora crenata]